MRILRYFVLGLLVIGNAALAWRFVAHQPPIAKMEAAPGVPIVTADVVQQDVPIWLLGLGTVQASNTVTIHPRVSGALEQVNFEEGRMVQAGEVLARIDARPYRSALEQAKAKKAQDEAQLANARREQERFQALVATRAETRRALDQAEASVLQFTALAQASQAAVEAAQLELDFTTVRSPIAGRTGVRLVDAGNLISMGSGSGIVVVAQLQPVAILFALPQQHLTALRRRLQADAAPPRVQALAEDRTTLAEGTLELIDNQIDTTTGTMRLKAVFPNTDHALWPGQFVSARILVETRRNAVVVPTPVVQAGIDGSFAYVVQADQKVEVRALKLGPTVDGMTIIEDGLRPGERVVRDGQSKLQPGARVSFAATPAM